VGVVGSRAAAAAHTFFGVHARRPGGRHDLDHLRFGSVWLDTVYLSGKVDPQKQGRLQGVLASITSLASVVGPLAISSLYFAYRASFPGLVWIAGAALYLLTVPVLLGLPAKSQRAARG
jgi:hypothetical protein